VAPGPWHVELVRIGAVSPTLAHNLRHDLGRMLARRVRLAPQLVDPAPCLDPQRRQYAADRLLEGLLQPPPPDGAKRIAITEVDLFLPVFTHVFGTAQTGGLAGVVSTFRLRPERSGFRPDATLLRRRILKAVLHELGHTLALGHCPVSWCAMRSSFSPQQVDLKDASFCEPCANAIGVISGGPLQD
jgi:archaemetzincin